MSLTEGLNPGAPGNGTPPQPPFPTIEAGDDDKTKAAKLKYDATFISQYEQTWANGINVCASLPKGIEGKS